MKIAYISDLHNDFLREEGQPVPDIELGGKADVLVLAGDIDVQEYGAEYALKQSVRLGIPVLYVLGNHEFYDTGYESVRDKVEGITQGTDVHFLDGDSVIIDDVMFIGATLWTDFMLLGKERHRSAVALATFQMNDYREIWLPDQPFFPKLTVNDTTLWHKFEKEFIEDELAKPAEFKKVVITHHAPSIGCLPPEEQNNLFSAAYASHLDELIERFDPAAWIYGHVHGESTIKVGKTKVCRNAMGYPDPTANNLSSYVPKIIQID